MHTALRRIALTVAATGWLAANAVADDLATSSSASAPSHHFRASRIESMKVRNAAGEDIGKIKDLVIDFNSGKIQYAALDFGGLFGVGDKLFAVPWSSFTCVEGSGVRADRHLVLDISKEQLKNAPGFGKNHWPDVANPNWANEVDKYYEHKKP
jgi:sporulation protein YlmC with PRC-barrel domain